jgi:peptidoglycan/LPS O-acetylase OafA/YrhL
LKSNRRQFAWAWCVLRAGLPFFILLKASDPMKSIWMSTMGLSWMAFLYLGLLLLALIYSDSRLGSALRTSWLKSLGTISYGVYLLHWPVLGLTFMIFKSKRPWAETLGERGLVLLALTLTIVIASFSWAVFEKPLLRIGHRVKYGSGA